MSIISLSSVSKLLPVIMNLAVKVIDNKDLFDAVISSDELSDETKERIKKWRKDTEERWQELLPDSE